MKDNIEVIAYKYEQDHPQSTIQQAFLDGYYQKNKRTIFKTELDMSIVPELLLPTVQRWLAYKKEKNESYKPIGFNGFIKKLIEYSNGNVQIADEIIDVSIANNYSGIFMLKNNGRYNQSRQSNSSIFSAADEILQRNNQ